MNQFPRDTSSSEGADTLIMLDYSIVNVNSKTDIEFIEFFAENDVNTILHKTIKPRKCEAILSGWQSRLWRDTTSFKSGWQSRLWRDTTSFKSGWQDSNLRPPHPKCGAIPGYATPRKEIWFKGC